MKIKFSQALFFPVIILGMFFWLFTQMPSANGLTCNVPGSYATIQTAVSDLSCDIIDISAGTFAENLTITRSLTLQGASKNSTIIDGSASGTVISIEPSITVSLTKMSIINGSAASGGGVHVDSSLVFFDEVQIANNKATTDFGGGINSNGFIFLTNSEVLTNSAQTFGGGIYNIGNMYIVSSTIRGNSAVHLMNAAGDGGGIANIDPAFLSVKNSAVNSNLAQFTAGGLYNTGTLIVESSTVDDNGAQAGTGTGGGILNGSGATLTIKESTISNNRVIADAGGIRNFGDLSLTNSTLSGNSANGTGALQNNGDAVLINNTISNNSGFLSLISGINAASGTVTMTNTIIANQGVGSNCGGLSGTIVSLGYNLDSDNSCSLTNVADFPNENPFLGPLQDNGGPTLTHALLTGSPAIDNGRVADCTPTDQRGYNRVGVCDIGAFEKQLDLFLPLVVK